MKLTVASILICLLQTTALAEQQTISKRSTLQSVFYGDPSSRNLVDKFTEANEDNDVLVWHVQQPKSVKLMVFVTPSDSVVTIKNRYSSKKLDKSLLVSKAKQTPVFPKTLFISPKSTSSLPTLTEVLDSINSPPEFPPLPPNYHQTIFEIVSKHQELLPAILPLIFGMIPPKPWRPERFFRPYPKIRQKRFVFESDVKDSTSSKKQLNDVIKTVTKLKEIPALYILRQGTKLGLFFGPKTYLDKHFRTSEEVSAWKSQENFRWLSQYLNYLNKLAQNERKALNNLLLPKFEKKSVYVFHKPPMRKIFKNVIEWRKTLAVPYDEKNVQFNGVRKRRESHVIKEIDDILNKPDKFKLVANDGGVQDNFEGLKDLVKLYYNHIVLSEDLPRRRKRSIFESVFNPANRRKPFVERFFQATYNQKLRVPKNKVVGHVASKNTLIPKNINQFNSNITFALPHPISLFHFNKKFFTSVQDISPPIHKKAKRFKRSFNTIFQSVFNQHDGRTLQQKFFDRAPQFNSLYRCNQHQSYHIQKPHFVTEREYGVPHNTYGVPILQGTNDFLFAPSHSTYGVPTINHALSKVTSSLPTVTKSKVTKNFHYVLPNAVKSKMFSLQGPNFVTNSKYGVPPQNLFGNLHSKPHNIYGVPTLQGNNDFIFAAPHNTYGVPKMNHALSKVTSLPGITKSKIFTLKGVPKVHHVSLPNVVKSTIFTLPGPNATYGVTKPSLPVKIDLYATPTLQKETNFTQDKKGITTSYSYYLGPTTTLNSLNKSINAVSTSHSYNNNTVSPNMHSTSSHKVPIPIGDVNILKQNKIIQFKDLIQNATETDKVSKSQNISKAIEIETNTVVVTTVFYNSLSVPRVKKLQVFKLIPSPLPNLFKKYQFKNNKTSSPFHITIDLPKSNSTKTLAVKEGDSFNLNLTQKNNKDVGLTVPTALQNNTFSSYNFTNKSHSAPKLPQSILDAIKYNAQFVNGDKVLEKNEELNVVAQEIKSNVMKVGDLSKIKVNNVNVQKVSVLFRNDSRLFGTRPVYFNKHLNVNRNESSAISTLELHLNSTATKKVNMADNKYVNITDNGNNNLQIPNTLKTFNFKLSALIMRNFTHNMNTFKELGQKNDLNIPTKQKASNFKMNETRNSYLKRRQNITSHDDNANLNENKYSRQRQRIKTTNVTITNISNNTLHSVITSSENFLVQHINTTSSNDNTNLKLPDNTLRVKTTNNTITNISNTTNSLNLTTVNTKNSLGQFLENRLKVPKINKFFDYRMSALLLNDTRGDILKRRQMIKPSNNTSPDDNSNMKVPHTLQENENIRRRQRIKSSNITLTNISNTTNSLNLTTVNTESSVVQFLENRLKVPKINKFFDYRMSALLINDTRGDILKGRQRIKPSNTISPDDNSNLKMPNTLQENKNVRRRQRIKSSNFTITNISNTTNSSNSMTANTTSSLVQFLENRLKVPKINKFFDYRMSALLMNDTRGDILKRRQRIKPTNTTSPDGITTLKVPNTLQENENLRQRQRIKSSNITLTNISNTTNSLNLTTVNTEISVVQFLENRLKVPKINKFFDYRISALLINDTRGDILKRRQRIKPSNTISPDDNSNLKMPNTLQENKNLRRRQRIKSSNITITNISNTTNSLNLTTVNTESSVVQFLENRLKVPKIKKLFDYRMSALLINDTRGDILKRRQMIKPSNNTSPDDNSNVKVANTLQENENLRRIQRIKSSNITITNISNTTNSSNSMTANTESSLVQFLENRLKVPKIKKFFDYRMSALLMNDTRGDILKRRQRIKPTNTTSPDDNSNFKVAKTLQEHSNSKQTSITISNCSNTSNSMTANTENFLVQFLETNLKVPKLKKFFHFKMSAQLMNDTRTNILKRRQRIKTINATSLDLNKEYTNSGQRIKTTNITINNTENSLVKLLETSLKVPKINKTFDYRMSAMLMNPSIIDRQRVEIVNKFATISNKNASSSLLSRQNLVVSSLKNKMSPPIPLKRVVFKNVVTVLKENGRSDIPIEHEIVIVNKNSSLEKPGSVASTILNRAKLRGTVNNFSAVNVRKNVTNLYNNNNNRSRFMFKSREHIVNEKSIVEEHSTSAPSKRFSLKQRPNLANARADTVISANNEPVNKFFVRNRPPFIKTVTATSEANASNNSETVTVATSVNSSASETTTLKPTRTLENQPSRITYTITQFINNNTRIIDRGTVDSSSRNIDELASTVPLPPGVMNDVDNVTKNIRIEPDGKKVRVKVVKRPVANRNNIVARWLNNEKLNENSQVEVV